MDGFPTAAPNARHAPYHSTSSRRYDGKRPNDGKRPVTLFSLSRCPVCRVRASTPRGACSACLEDLFAPEVHAGTLTLGVYEGRLERAVRAFKFQHATRLAGVFGAALAAEVARRGWQVDTVCAVPLHLRRTLQRGYNQSALIAKRVAADRGVPYTPLLTRTRATRQQARLHRGERFKNVEGAFQAKNARGKRVLLVDDVVTSGATSSACRQALERAGAAEVRLAAVARAK